MFAGKQNTLWVAAISVDSCTTMQNYTSVMLFSTVNPRFFKFKSFIKHGRKHAHTVRRLSSYKLTPRKASKFIVFRPKPTNRPAYPDLRHPHAHIHTQVDRSQTGLQTGLPGLDRSETPACTHTHPSRPVSDRSTDRSAWSRPV